MSLTDWLSHISQVTGTALARLEDPAVLEEAIADLWLGGAPLDGALQPTVSAPPTLAQARVEFGGTHWSRHLVSNADLKMWGAQLATSRADADPDAPALGVPLQAARDIARAQGGRLPTLKEWHAAVADAAPGNHSLHWGGPSRPGAFPAARSGILDGWGNAWEWTEDGLAVGGSFASPAQPDPTPNARLTSFRILH